VIPLWSINRWLRYTGFRLVVARNDEDPENVFHSIGFKFFGWKGLR
jgi:hypothetical protein